MAPPTRRRTTKETDMSSRTTLSLSLPRRGGSPEGRLAPTGRRLAPITLPQGAPLDAPVLPAPGAVEWTEIATRLAGTGRSRSDLAVGVGLAAVLAALWLGTLAAVLG
jgi:hypothetical protein